MSRRMLRNTDRKLSFAGVIGTFALVISLESAAAVGVLDVRKIISAPGQPSAADRTTIDTYLKADFFRHFAKPVGGGAKLPELRKDYGNIVTRVGRTPGHDYLNQNAYKFAEMVVRGSSDFFPPVSKYNAMLLIADMNESDIPGAIKPYTPALQVLGRTLAAPESDSDYLKAAALVGVTRLAEEKALPANYVGPFSGVLLKILNDAEPPEGRSTSAHTFMRRSAARALAAIGSPGPNYEVVKAMRSAMVDPNAKLTMRCEMAQLFAQLNIPPDAKVDCRDLANLIGHQTVEICEQEIARAAEEKREPSRRIIMYALRSADMGLSGLKTEDASKFVAKLRNKLSQLHGQLDDVSKTPNNKIEEMIVPELDSIRELLDPKPEPENTPTASPAATETAAKPAS